MGTQLYAPERNSLSIAQRVASKLVDRTCSLFLKITHKARTCRCCQLHGSKPRRKREGRIAGWRCVVFDYTLFSQAAASLQPYLHLPHVGSTIQNPTTSSHSKATSADCTAAVCVADRDAMPTHATGEWQPVAKRTRRETPELASKGDGRHADTKRTLAKQRRSMHQASLKKHIRRRPVSGVRVKSSHQDLPT